MIFHPPLAAAPSRLSSEQDSAQGMGDLLGGFDDWVVGAIARAIAPIDEMTPSRAVVAMFEADAGLSALAIRRRNGGYGLIDRSSLLTQFARRYGRELFEKKPISALMETKPLVADAFDQAATVSQRIADEMPVALSTGFIVNEDGRYLGVASGVDLLRLQARQLVTALDNLHEVQRDLAQSEKMASLGQLVAGIAHEINTPIGIGLTAASHLREATGKFDRLFLDNKLKRSDLEYYVGIATESAEMIESNIDRAARLIQSFKQVAIDQTSGDRRRFGFATHLDDVLVSLSPELKHSPHRVVVDCECDFTLDSYPGALTQVYANLVLNALIHAFSPDKPGIISISARKEGSDAVIVIADDGKGIPPEHMPKIYDPFFTTRRGQGGSGLGLHIVFNIVTASLRGRISCRSVVGKGTAFTIRLPASLDAGTSS